MDVMNELHWVDLPVIGTSKKINEPEGMNSSSQALTVELTHHLNINPTFSIADLQGYNSPDQFYISM